MNYHDPVCPPYSEEALRIEGVTTCVGFDDMLDVSLSANHKQFDHLIVVTSHQDKATQKVCHKHGVTCVQTDLFKKHNRNFNKGAAINAGFDYFRYHGWRVHLDADIILPDNFRRVLFNNTHLDQNCMYGCDRMDVIWDEKLLHKLQHEPQHINSYLIHPKYGTMSPRYMDDLRGYVPIGYFQMWHARHHKSYPFSLGTAAHDDVMFAGLWPESHRRHLPTVVAYHIVVQPPKMSENWDGHRKHPRIDGKK